MYNIRLLNKISPVGLDLLDKKYFKCDEDAQNPDGIIVRSASMHDMEIPASVKAIARAGAGTNNIPIDKCSAAGVVVFNTPGGNANAVKELTIAGLLLSARKIFPAMSWVQSIKGQDDDIAKSVEKAKGKFSGPELKGKKLGVIGLGAIGVMVCNAAAHFGMDVYGYDPFLSIESALKLSRSAHVVHNLKEIFEQCDFITLHVPLTHDTKGMINSQSINSMKHGVRILNFSRGELVVDDDIIEAVNEKQVYCYITDFPNEKLLGHNGIIALPHLGATTPESEENCAAMAAAQLKDYLMNGNIVNSVNLPTVVVDRKNPATGRISIIHKNIPNMLAKITGTLGNNISNLTNDSKGEYAYSLIDIEDTADDATVEKLRSIEGVIRVNIYK